MHPVRNTNSTEHLQYNKGSPARVRVRGLLPRTQDPFGRDYGMPGNLSGSSPGGVSPRMSAQVPSKPPYEPSLDAGLGGAAGSVM